MSPTTFFLLIFTVIGTFKAFNHIYVMTRGGPGGATTTASILIFQQLYRVQSLRLQRRTLVPPVLGHPGADGAASPLRRYPGGLSSRARADVPSCLGDPPRSRQPARSRRRLARPANLDGRRGRVTGSLLYVVLIAGAVMAVVPFIYMLMTSFKTYGERDQQHALAVAAVRERGAAVCELPRAIKTVGNDPSGTSRCFSATWRTASS